MQEVNPYSAPVSALDPAAADVEFDESPWYSLRGRCGRLTYLAWTLLAYFCVGLVSALVVNILSVSDDPVLLQAVMALFSLAALPFVAIFSVRRLHDFNQSGWWAVLLVVPPINALFGLALTLIGGSAGGNQYGAVRLTRPWEKVVGILAIIFAVLAVAGIAAAILIPLILQTTV